MSQNRVARSAAALPRTALPGGAGIGVRSRMSEPPRESPRQAAPPRPRPPRTPRAELAGRVGAGGSGRMAGGGGAGGARGGAGPLTGLGVALLLVVASALGALLDLFLVGGPDWALTALYIAACGYTAGRVRPADRFAALVAPPLAFAAAVLLLAFLMPDTFGHGLLGLAASSFALLAAKAKALYFGTALTAAVLLVRWTKTRRR